MFTTGKYAPAECDRCGRKTKYLKLKEEIYNEKKTGLRVCGECFDKDHPQLQLGRLKIFDPQTLKDPRPSRDDDGATTPYDPEFLP
jgi:hypothetical protein